MRSQATLLAFTLLAVGCGGRSALLEGGATSTSSTSSTGAGAGGSGGSPACVLTSAGEDVALAPTPGFHERRPALVTLGGTEDAALVFALDPVAAPQLADIPIADVTLAPFGAWPPAVSAQHPISDIDGDSFAVAPRSGATYSLMAATQFSGLFAADVDPQGGALTLMPGSPQGILVFLTNVGDKHLTELYFGEKEANLSRVVRLSGPSSSDFQIGCNAAPIPGDAIPFQGAFLWAGATAFLDTSCPNVAEPAVHLIIQRLALSGALAKPSAPTLELPEAPTRIRLAPRSAGAWLLWQGASRIHAQRLGGDAAPDLPDLVVEPDAAEGLAVAAYQGGFAAAWIASTGIAIAVFDDTGARVQKAEIPVAPGAVVTGPLSMLASANALVVAWSQEDGGQPAQVHVARFDDCGG